jgi:hypothetical protein
MNRQSQSQLTPDKDDGKLRPFPVPIGLQQQVGKRIQCKCEECILAYNRGHPSNEWIDYNNSRKGLANPQL